MVYAGDKKVVLYKRAKMTHRESQYENRALGGGKP